MAVHNNYCAKLVALLLCCMIGVIAARPIHGEGEEEMPVTTDAVVIALPSVALAGAGAKYKYPNCPDCTNSHCGCGPLVNGEGAGICCGHSERVAGEDCGDSVSDMCSPCQHCSPEEPPQYPNCPDCTNSHCGCGPLVNGEGAGICCGYSERAAGEDCGDSVSDMCSPCQHCSPEEPIESDGYSSMG